MRTYSVNPSQGDFSLKWEKLKYFQPVASTMAFSQDVF
jgi:hypothetical protein